MRTVRDPTPRKVFRSSRVLIFMNQKQTNHFRQVCKRRQICLQIGNNVLVTCLVQVTQLPALMGARIALIAIQILNKIRCPMWSEGCSNPVWTNKFHIRGLPTELLAILMEHMRSQILGKRNHTRKNHTNTWASTIIKTNNLGC
jgi:hypothetical protein